MSEYQPIPQSDNNAEEALLSILLAWPDEVDAVRAVLKPEAFYRVDHQKIYRAILELHDGKNTPDVVTLAAWLSANDTTEADWFMRLMPIFTSATSTVMANTQQYARIIADHARKRKLTHLASKLAAATDTAEQARIVSEMNATMEVAASDSWKVRTLKQAYAPRPPRTYVVDKFLAVPSLNIVYGSPASMKSMLLADMCACVVSGQDWLPGVEKSGGGVLVEQSPILWIDMDNGNDTTDERIEAVSKVRNLPEDAPFYYVSMPVPTLQISSLDSVMRLVNTINQTGAKLVVMDNLGLIAGDVEENSGSMAQVMGHLRMVAEKTRAALVVIHHKRKGDSNGGRAGDALRGHSSIEASLDLALSVTREPDSQEVTIRSTKTRGVDVPRTTAVFNFTHKPGLNELETAWFSGKPIARGVNPIRDAIIFTLKEADQPMTKGRLTDVVHEYFKGKYGINKIRNWITELEVVSKEVVITRAGKGHPAMVELA